MIMKSAAFTGIAAGVLALAACSSAGGGQAAPTSPPAPRPAVYDCAGHPQTRPASFVLACADGNAVLTKITWSAWSASGARGTGQLTVNNCQPSCAGGKFVSTPTAIALSRPHAGAGTPYFTHLATSAPLGSTRSWPLGTHGPGS